MDKPNYRLNSPLGRSIKVPNQDLAQVISNLSINSDTRIIEERTFCLTDKPSCTRDCSCDSDCRNHCYCNNNCNCEKYDPDPGTSTSLDS